MCKNRNHARITSLAAGTVLALGLAAGAAYAQDFQQNVSCVSGEVKAFDYNELEENFREGVWDKRAGVQLVSESEVIRLQVVDANNKSICENTADLRTKCTFSLTLNDNFSIKVTNFDNPVYARYRLCAY